MVSLTWLNIDFVRTLELAIEFGRITLALDFRPPPPEYTFRGLEPVYKKAIEHYQGLCEKAANELDLVNEEKADEENVDHPNQEDVASNDVKFDELEELLHKHSRLITNLSTLVAHPHLHPRSHSDYTPSFPPSKDELLGAERFIAIPMQGFGFSNDYIRQWLAAIPGRLGRRFEREEAGKINLTEMFGRILVALIGGAALLVPMIVMTFVERRKWRLIVVSVATILFGMAFAVVSKSKENVLAGTAAYAAVMVVYTGSASGPMSS